MKKVCIVGAGAIGGLIGTRLAAAGTAQVGVLARGATLEALRSQGWRMQSTDGLLQVTAVVSSDPRKLGVQDLVVIAVKCTALTQVAVGYKAAIRPVKDISIGDQTALLDSSNRVMVTLRQEKPLSSFDFNNLLDGSIPPSALRNRVVVIGYDGPTIPQVSGPIGTMGAHRLFVHMLKGFYESMTPSKAAEMDVQKGEPR